MGINIWIIITTHYYSYFPSSEIIQSILYAIQNKNLRVTTTINYIYIIFLLLCDEYFGGSDLDLDTTG